MPNILDPPESIVVVDSLSKSFVLPHERLSGIKQLIIGILNRRTKKGYEVQHVLKHVSFSVKKGEFIGIVGRNGSGKSTLLKILAGIYKPDSGRVSVRGSVTPFIELGVGFNPELTGTENVYLNGALLGFDRKQVKDIYQDIVEFAELDKFMDQKLKNYSSGMQVRLAFSIAIQANSDILILDEVLAVGDEAFQRKCFQYFEDLKKNNKTVILVTHSMDSVRRYCDRAVMISHGKVVAIGSPDDMANKYSLDNLNQQQTNPVASKRQQKFEEGRNDIVPELNIIILSDLVINNTNTLKFKIEFKTTDNIDVYAGFSISYNGISMVERNSKEYKTINKKGAHSLEYSMPLDIFNDAELKISCGLFRTSTGEEIAYTTDKVGSKYFKVIGVDTRKDAGGVMAESRGGWL